MSHPELNQRTAAATLRDAFEKVVQTQQEPISEAAKLVFEAIMAGGIVQVFGTGHSRSFAMEIAGRAGGLIPANKLSLTDLVFLDGADPGTVNDPTLERDETVGVRLLSLYDVAPADVFIICSNSGGNGSTVELAQQVKARGHALIAVTSMDHTTKISSRHSSGKRLFEIADVVIDNGGVYGDATLELPPGPVGQVQGAVLATSTVTSALIAQLMVTEACGLLVEADHEVPVFVSANVPDGDAHNDALRARYSSRIPNTP